MYRFYTSSLAPPSETLLQTLKRWKRDWYLDQNMVASTSPSHTWTRGKRMGGSTRENTRNPFVKNGYLWCEPSLTHGGRTWLLTTCVLLLMMSRKLLRYQEQRGPLWRWFPRWTLLLLLLESSKERVFISVTHSVICSKRKWEISIIVINNS